MFDTVIDIVNLLGKYQQELLMFTDFSGRLIGYGDVNMKGLDGDGDGNENEAPLKLKIKMISTIKRIKRRSIPISRIKPLFKNTSK